MTNPTDFSNYTIQWIDAFYAIFNHLMGVIIVIGGSAGYLQLKSRLDQHRAELNALNPKVVPVPTEIPIKNTPSSLPPSTANVPMPVVQIPIAPPTVEITHVVPPAEEVKL